MMREHVKRAVALGLVALLPACQDTADTFPLNPAARQIGTPKVSFVRTGIGRGPVTITMPDGEVLTGEYRVAFGGGEAFTFAGGQTASTLLMADGSVQFVATGPKTQVLCRGTSSPWGMATGNARPLMARFGPLAGKNPSGHSNRKCLIGDQSRALYLLLT
jgi:hypothetical protein